MKKNILGVYILLLAFVNISFAGPSYYPVKILFKDGKVITGLAAMPDPGDRQVIYKKGEKDEKEKIESEVIKTISFYIEKDTVEMEQIHIISLLTKKAGKTPYWVSVWERGYCTLFYGVKEGGSFTTHGNIISSDRIWYCQRIGEEAATVISLIGGINKNTAFKSYAPKYFSDYPELVEKINSKAYTYENVMDVVKEYNKWKNKK